MKQQEKKKLAAQAAAEKKKQNRLVLILAGVAAAAIVVMIIALCTMNNFDPPPFEKNAVRGVPEAPEELGYSTLDVEAGYSVGLCSNLTAKDGAVDIYLTNPETNTLWLKVRIYDSAGNILGESGILKNGEYVKSVALSSVPSERSDVKLKIMGYEPKKYTSRGAVELNTVLKVR